MQLLFNTLGMAFRVYACYTHDSHSPSLPLSFPGGCTENAHARWLQLWFDENKHCVPGWNSLSPPTVPYGCSCCIALRPRRDLPTFWLLPYGVACGMNNTACEPASAGICCLRNNWFLTARDRPFHDLAYSTGAATRITNPIPSYRFFPLGACTGFIFPKRYRDFAGVKLHRYHLSAV